MPVVHFARTGKAFLLPSKKRIKVIITFQIVYTNAHIYMIDNICTHVGDTILKLLNMCSTNREGHRKHTFIIM